MAPSYTMSVVLFLFVLSRWSMVSCLYFEDGRKFKVLTDTVPIHVPAEELIEKIQKGEVSIQLKRNKNILPPAAATATGTATATQLTATAPMTGTATPTAPRTATAIATAPGTGTGIETSPDTTVTSATMVPGVPPKTVVPGAAPMTSTPVVAKPATSVPEVPPETLVPGATSAAPMTGTPKAGVPGATSAAPTAASGTALGTPGTATVTHGRKFLKGAKIFAKMVVIQGGKVLAEAAAAAARKKLSDAEAKQLAANDILYDGYYYDDDDDAEHSSYTSETVPFNGYGYETYDGFKYDGVSLILLIFLFSAICAIVGCVCGCGGIVVGFVIYNQIETKQQKKFLSEPRVEV